jgi:hypothetical protein
MPHKQMEGTFIKPPKKEDKDNNNSSPSGYSSKLSTPTKKVKFPQLNSPIILPVIDSPMKNQNQPGKLKAIYQNPEHLTQMKNSIYIKLAEDQRSPERQAYSGFNRGEQVKYDLFKKKYEEMQYLENLFTKKNENEIMNKGSPLTPQKEDEDYKMIVNSIYQNKNLSGF